MQQVESTIKRLIANRLSRGRVDVSLQYDRAEEISYEINRPLITGFLAAMKDMQSEFSLSGEPDINVVARLPNVLLTKKDDLSDEFIVAVESAVGAALDDLEKMRGNEGSMLAADLGARLAEIERHLEPIESEAAGVTEEYRQKLSKRIAEMLAKSDSQIEIDQ